MSPLRSARARSFAAATVFAASLAGCARPLQITARDLRYPVSLTGVVYGPDHRLLGDADLEAVGEIDAEGDLCELERRSADGSVDLSSWLNAAIARSDSEAVVDFHIALRPPSGSDSFHELDTRCVLVRWTGTFVRRVARQLPLAEVRVDCEARRARACAELARRTLTGEGVDADARAALQLYTDACERGDAASCAGAAAMWRAGRADGPADPSRALTIEQRACDLGAVDACGRVGVALADDRSALYDPARARAALAAPCRAGDAASCTALGGLLSSGAGGAVDVPQALDLFRRSCARDASACTRAAAVYAAGRDGQPDLRAALALYALGCDRGDATACVAAGEIYAHGPASLASPILARRSFERACADGVRAACERVAADPR